MSDRLRNMDSIERDYARREGKFMNYKIAIVNY